MGQRHAAWLVFVPLLAGCAISPLVRFEESLVFQRQHPLPPGWPAQETAYEEVWLQTADGVRLHGRFAGADQPRAVVLYAHGNAESVATCEPVLRLYRDRLQASVLVFDYRGYGQSEGTPEEAGILADARAARRWLAQRTGVSERDIVLVGHSLGGGVMVDLAARDGARGLILENTFTSLPDVAAYHFPFLPVHWLMKTQLNSLAKIAAYHGPLLQTHGDADRVVPFALGKKLFETANEPKHFLIVPGGDHNTPLPRAYLSALDHFLDSLP